MMKKLNDKQNKPDNQEKKAKEKEDKQEEMSMNSGMPDLENEAKESAKLTKTLK